MERQYVGVDLHRRRSVVVRKSGAGEVVGAADTDSEPMAFAGRDRQGLPQPRGGP